MERSDAAAEYGLEDSHSRTPEYLLRGMLRLRQQSRNRGHIAPISRAEVWQMTSQLEETSKPRTREAQSTADSP